jgi:NADH-quinone oxidoreductase subunit N
MISAQLLDILLLVLGAIVVLLAAGAISTVPLRATLIGVPFALVAALIGWFQAPPPVSLAIVAPCLVATVALMLLPVLEAEVPAHVAEAAALLLLGTSGAIALATAADLLWAVVGLETLALSAVVLVALGAGDRCLEAAFKYLVLGAISLAALLFGVGLIYLGTGSLAFPGPAQVTGSHLTLAGVILVGLGFAFELALFPLHWAALDAYTAAAPSVAGFIMSASKLAAAFILGRLVVTTGVEASQVLIWLGVITIVWGTFGAINQAANLRRMLAYSAITHAGFIGLAAGSGPDGLTTAGFYAAVYGATAMLVFATLAGTGPDPDLRGLGRLRALGLGLGLLSLSGIPPTPGFWAKLAVLVIAWQYAGVIPTLIAVLGGVFSVLYYLRPLPDLLAALRSDDSIPMPKPVVAPGIVLAGVVVVLISLFPGVVWMLARS